MGQAFGTTNSHNDEQRHYTRKEIGMSIVLFVIVGVADGEPSAVMLL